MAKGNIRTSLDVAFARWMYMTDIHRPTYHFMPPANWMNDPNGLIQWGDQYHLFYQYNPYAAVHGRIHWGHAVSRDLVHWQHEPIALTPDADGPDADGCWSGCTVDDQGTPTIIYSGHRRGRVELPCIARSSDGLRTWRKDPHNPLFDAPADPDLLDLRDHVIWREADQWQMLMGAGLRARGGAVLQYRSPDLRSWEACGPLLAEDELAPHLHAPLAAKVWECPDFFALADRQVLLLSICSDQPHHSAILIGDYHDRRFVPTVAHKLDYGDRYWYAPQSFRDQRGRRIVFGWAMEGRSSEAQQAAGWSGVMALPRELDLDPAGDLLIRPAAELAGLRGRHTSLRDLSIPESVVTPLPSVVGECLELQLELHIDAAGSAGVLLRRSPDGSEETRIVYSAERGELRIDRARSSLNPSVERNEHVAPLRLAAGEPLRLHIFLDRSILEVFANERVAMTTRLYPTLPASRTVALIAEQHAARLSLLDTWELNSIW